MCFRWEKPTTKAKPAGRQHASYTSPWLPRQESDDLGIFGLYPGKPSTVYLPGWIKYLTARSTIIPMSPYAFPRDCFELSVWGWLRGWQRGVGHIRIGRPEMGGWREHQWHGQHTHDK